MPACALELKRAAERRESELVTIMPFVRWSTTVRVKPMRPIRRRVNAQISCCDITTTGGVKRAKRNRTTSRHTFSFYGAFHEIPKRYLQAVNCYSYHPWNEGIIVYLRARRMSRNFHEWRSWIRLPNQTIGLFQFDEEDALPSMVVSCMSINQTRRSAFLPYTVQGTRAAPLAAVVDEHLRRTCLRCLADASSKTLRCFSQPFPIQLQGQRVLASTRLRSSRWKQCVTQYDQLWTWK